MAHVYSSWNRLPLHGVVLIKANAIFASSHLILINIISMTGWEGVQMFSLGAVPTRLETTSIKGRARAPAGSAAHSHHAQGYKAVH
jgi:hypothetical protein